MDLTGVALITGGASGIGRATAMRFAAEGCRRLLLADVDETGLKCTKKELTIHYTDIEVLTLKIDLRKEESVDKFVIEAARQFGRIDYCCNIAGITLGGITTEFQVADFDSLYQVNLRGVFLCERAQLRVMVKQEPLVPKHSKHPSRGVITNVSSLAGLIAYPSLPAYAAMKHGVAGLTKSDALQYGPEGIRINVVCPGAINTPINKNLSTDTTDSWGNLLSITALRRIGDPDEVAQTIAWLSSGRASYVTGSTISVNGGREGGS